MKKVDVLEFAEKVEGHLLNLASDLASGRYTHGQYSRFVVCDPKRREIAKAPVRDRVLHHAIVRVLTLIFEKRFIFDSYSSRKEKGIHKAGKRLRSFAWKLSRNHTCTVWVLQCDIRKYFDSINQEILIQLLQKNVPDRQTMKLLILIIQSFEMKSGHGIPLGNLTSQLFSNVYLDPLDQFIKRTLRVKYYLRYADDFVLLSRERDFLEECLIQISEFLQKELKLELHPLKVTFKKWQEGIDFLGYVHFPFHCVLRIKTKRRMLVKLLKAKKSPEDENEGTNVYFENVKQSYLGVLKHCRGKKLEKKIRSI